MNRRRRPGPATTEEVERGLLRAAYIERFARGPGFRRELKRLAARHRIGSVVERELRVAEVIDWELRLAREGESPTLAEDAEAILRRLWLDRLDGRERWVIRNGIVAWLVSDAPIKFFATFAGGFIAGESEIGDVEVGREVVSLPDGRPLVGLVLRPLVRVGIEDEWYPDREGRAEAKQRLLARVAELLDRELDRIEAHAERLGYRFPDTRPNLDRDLDWLVAHVRDRRSYAAIAAEASMSPYTVRNAVRALARLVGVPI